MAHGIDLAELTEDELKRLEREAKDELEARSVKAHEDYKESTRIGTFTLPMPRVIEPECKCPWHPGNRTFYKKSKDGHAVFYCQAGHWFNDAGELVNPNEL